MRHLTPVITQKRPCILFASHAPLTGSVDQRFSIGAMNNPRLPHGAFFKTRKSEHGDDEDCGGITGFGETEMLVCNAESLSPI